MSKQTIIGDALPNIPWQEKPAGCIDVIWRHDQNPLIKRRPIPCAEGIYNSAVIPYNGRFVGIFRADYRDRFPHLHFGRSDDGLNWQIDHEKIELKGADPEIANMKYCYDPRLCKIHDTYYITWCTEYHGPTIGVATTKDFKEYTQLENAFLPFNRNGVLFPRKIDGNFAMLNRPSDNGHTPFGDIYYSQSPDMCHWGRHRFVMGAGPHWFQATKIGAGPIPIETTEGWLMIYHAVFTTCNGYVYSVGAALLDIDTPYKVLYRTNQHLLAPQADYEVTGYVPNVVFPCAALCDAPTGRIAIYYGAADTYTCLACTQVDELIEFIKNNSDVS